MKLSDFPGTADYLKTIQVGEGKTEDVPIPDWVFGPTSLHEESEWDEEANWDYAIEALDHVDPYGNDYEVVEFPITVGEQYESWMRALFTRPGSKAAELAERLAARLLEEGHFDEEWSLQYKVRAEEEAAEEAAKEARQDTGPYVTVTSAVGPEGCEWDYSG